MSSYANALVEVIFLTEDIGFASGRSNNGATILKTNNGGTSWTEIFNSNIAGEYVWKLQILQNNSDVIFGSISSITPNLGKLIKSVDAGLTWTSFDAAETNIQAVGFIDENIGWMGGHTTGFYETNDGGQSWTNLNIGNNLNRIFILSSTLAYAGGTSLYKFTSENLNSDNFIEPVRSPLLVALKNNPVNSLLEFCIEYMDDDNVLIELYDINGKFIKQLIKDSTKIKRSKNYKFNIHYLKSGTYLLNVHSNTGRQSIKFIKE
jgi:hypothetical protein